MSEELVHILQGSTFVVSGRNGDVDASPTDPMGFFAGDTRHLSRWLLTLDDRPLNALSTDDLQYFETRFFLVPGTGTVYVDAPISVIRTRTVASDGFEDALAVMNHEDRTVEVEVALEAASDFADIFEMKDALEKKGSYEHHARGGQLVLGYRRETFYKGTRISASEPASVKGTSLVFRATIPPHGIWRVRLDVRALDDPGGTKRRARRRPDASVEREAVQAWVGAAPDLQSDSGMLKLTYFRSLVDLAALRFAPRTMPGRSLPAAGLPWFMAMFGRDSIFTSLQALPFASELAATTLRALAERQGTRIDDFRDEDPGRIIHEMRVGELTAFEERPHSPYYGNADATALFVVLLDEYERWTGDVELVAELEFEARAALGWIDHYADLQHNGYVSYATRNRETGLENQCWKDSWDSISYHDGRLPGFPRATCELQGYAYDAKVRAARLARLVWHDGGLADRLEKEAESLKARFNEDFWVGDGEYFAVALDADGRRVDSLTSNIGHLLWSGIVDEDKAPAVVAHLMGDRLFSGWGVRTLVVGEGRYNPVGYHVGTVWPFDNSIIAWGLRRYGYKEEAARVAAGVLDAAEFFLGRLPEAFAGYTRAMTRYPVRYPTACSPQAWSAGTPLLLLRTMLGLEPIDGHLVVDPVLPDTLGWIELLEIPGRWGTVDAYGRGRTAAPRTVFRAMPREERPPAEPSAARSSTRRRR
ncbi:MAG TPA: glycogen debranching N-terminal domain-containing protein [Acidimicrobiales bacterium]|nr:glycogen debranching N-terminal domain-containing protein [Acidimicrobiales bacterium]